MSDTSDLYTTIKNPTASARFYGYVRTHGRRIAAGGSVTVYGALESQLNWNLRKQKSLERDLLAGLVEIISTPKPILADTAQVAQLSNPTTTATVSATGGGSSGGNLPAGTYQVAYTFYNAYGETTSGGRSTTFTVASGNIPRVTLPAIPSGATGIKVYLTNTSAPTGTPKYFNKITSGTTLDLDSTSWNEGTQTYSAASAAPSSNTTKGPTMFTEKVTAGSLGVTDPSWGRYTG